MTSKKFISGALTLAIGLGTANSAWADSSSRGGYRDSARVASCDDARESSTSYRDAAARSDRRSTALVARGEDGYRGRFAHSAEQQALRRFASAMGLACSS